MKLSRDLAIGRAIAFADAQSILDLNGYDLTLEPGANFTVNGLSATIKSTATAQTGSANTIYINSNQTFLKPIKITGTNAITIDGGGNTFVVKSLPLFDLSSNIDAIVRLRNVTLDFRVSDPGTPLAFFKGYAQPQSFVLLDNVTLRATQSFLNNLFLFSKSSVIVVNNVHVDGSSQATVNFCRTSSDKSTLRIGAECTKGALILERDLIFNFGSLSAIQMVTGNYKPSDGNAWLVLNGCTVRTNENISLIGDYTNPIPA